MSDESMIHSRWIDYPESLRFMLWALDELQSGRRNLPNPAAIKALKDGVRVYSELFAKAGYEKFTERVDRDYLDQNVCNATFATDFYRELRSFLESELQRECGENLHGQQPGIPGAGRLNNDSSKTSILGYLLLTPVVAFIDMLSLGLLSNPTGGSNWSILPIFGLIFGVPTWLLAFPIIYYSTEHKYSEPVLCYWWTAAISLGLSVLASHTLFRGL